MDARPEIVSQSVVLIKNGHAERDVTMTDYDSLKGSKGVPTFWKNIDFIGDQK